MNKIIKDIFDETLSPFQIYQTFLTIDTDEIDENNKLFYLLVPNDYDSEWMYSSNVDNNTRSYIMGVYILVYSNFLNEKINAKKLIDTFVVENTKVFWLTNRKHWGTNNLFSFYVNGKNYLKFYHMKSLIADDKKYKSYIINFIQKCLKMEYENNTIKKFLSDNQIYNNIEYITNSFIYHYHSYVFSSYYAYYRQYYIDEFKNFLEFMSNIVDNVGYNDLAVFCILQEDHYKLNEKLDKKSDKFFNYKRLKNKGDKETNKGIQKLLKNLVNSEQDSSFGIIMKKISSNQNIDIDLTNLITCVENPCLLNTLIMFAK